jgi:RNA polymerase-interacting CarD/CdnL/TRCF family regulator
MQFSVGDKVVHRAHGPGRVAGIERREMLDGSKRYYVIEIPSQGLTLYIPLSGTGDPSVRPAMSQASLARVLSVLGGKPHRLPADYRQRQDRISAQIKTGRVIHLVRAVRDLTWHRHHAHLTKTDSDYLKLGRGLLAAEMALVSGDDVTEASRLIEDAMTAAIQTGN